MNYTIRSISRSELDIPIDWAALEGWNPGLFDADAFYASDPKGFFMGFLGNEPISSISAVKYDDIFGFIGFYIVKPEYRGKGYGYRIWKEAMKYLDGHVVGLDGVLNQQATYKLSGFNLAYRNIRYKGKGVHQTNLDPNIMLLSKIPFSTLLSYDEKIFPVSRSKFLKLWITQPESLAIGYIKNQKLLGYGVIRKCRVGYKVGPLFADNDGVANAIFQRLQTHAGESSSIFLDVPGVHSSAVALAKKYHMVPMFETARMYIGEKSARPIGKGLRSHVI